VRRNLVSSQEGVASGVGSVRSSFFWVISFGRGVQASLTCLKVLIPQAPTGPPLQAPEPDNRSIALLCGPRVLGIRDGEPVSLLAPQRCL
jgi:hypothetical protein